jgi:tape measure domain-containing protein
MPVVSELVPRESSDIEGAAQRFGGALDELTASALQASAALDRIGQARLTVLATDGGATAAQRTLVARDPEGRAAIRPASAGGHQPQSLQPLNVGYVAILKGVLEVGSGILAVGEAIAGFADDLIVTRKELLSDLGVDLSGGGRALAASDAATNLEQLSSYTRTPIEFERNFVRLQEILLKTATPFEALVDIQTAMVERGFDRRLGFAQQTQAVELLGQGIQASTSDPAKALAAGDILQQAILDDRLTGEAARRLHEMAPVLVQAIAKRFDKTVAEILREAEAGEIDADRLLHDVFAASDILVQRAEEKGISLKQAATTVDEVEALKRATSAESIADSQQQARELLDGLRHEDFEKESSIRALIGKDEITDLILDLGELIDDYKGGLKSFDDEDLDVARDDLIFVKNKIESLQQILVGEADSAIASQFEGASSEYKANIENSVQELEDLQTKIDALIQRLNEKQFLPGKQTRSTEALEEQKAEVEGLNEAYEKLNPTLEDNATLYERATTGVTDLTEETDIATSSFAGVNRELNQTNRELDELAGRKPVKLSGTGDDDDDRKDLLEETSKVTQAFMEMGDSASAAFQRAVLGGGDLSDVLMGLEQDLIRIALQRTLFDQVDTFLGAASLGVGNFISSFLFADGGIMTAQGPLPLERYAGGGIARRPQLALFGEGSTPEAYVPVPSGRIPVELRMPEPPREGSVGGGGLVIQNYVTVEGGASAQAGGDARLASQIGRRIGEEVRAVVREELLAQSRPGAMLNPIGAF